MFNKKNISLVLTGLFIVQTGNYLIAQDRMLAYNNGISTVTVESGLTVTIQGGFSSQRSGSVDGQIYNSGTIQISGDVVNNNTANTAFTTNTGTIELNGTTASQTISGTYDPYFYNLTLNNSYATSPQFVLSITSTVQNALTLNSGMVSMGSKNLTIGTSASSYGSVSRTSGYFYGSGSFIRWFPTSTFALSAGLFPIGTSSDYRPFSLAATSAPSTGGKVTVSHTSGTAAVTVSFADGGSTVGVRTSHAWTVSTNTLAGGTYSAEIDGTGLGVIGSTADLRIVQASAAAGGSAGTNGGSISNPSIVRTGMSLANLTSTFYIGSVNTTSSPLPIELINFSAIYSSSTKSVDLNWKTATETNNDYFTIERTIDGDNFEFVQKIQGAGNSSTINFYTTKDDAPHKGISYYRLKQTDFDGTSTYSNLQTIVINDNQEDSGNLDIFPNPVTSNLISIAYSSTEDEEILIVIRDFLGREFYSKAFVTQTGDNVYKINTEDKLPSGIYMVTASGKSNKLYSKKIFID